jgi:uncharacterized protein (TIGR03546 family)
MIKMIAKLLKVLSSETEPGQISLALCLAMILGLTPLMSLHNLLVLLVILLVRVNLATCILGWAFFSGVAYLLDPLFNWIGLVVLTSKGLEGFWTALYNIPLFRLAKFNHSIVMGSLLVSLILFIPLYLLLNLGIRRYRDHVLEWVKKTRLMQAFKANKLYKAYQAVSGWGGSS